MITAGWINYQGYKDSNRRTEVYIPRSELPSGRNTFPRANEKTQQDLDLGHINEYRDVLRRTHTVLGDREKIDSDPDFSRKRSKDSCGGSISPIRKKFKPGYLADHITTIPSVEIIPPHVDQNDQPLLGENSKLINNN